MDGTVTNWLRQVRKSTEDDVVERLWNYFSSGMLREAKPKCQQLRIGDENDVVTSAFFHLIKAMRDEKTKDFASRREFWRLLRIITKRQISDWVRREHAQKRGGGRVISMSSIERANELFEAQQSDPHVCEEDLLGRLQALAKLLKHPKTEQVIHLKVRGRTNSKIAQELGLSVRTIQYLISDIEAAWKREFFTKRTTKVS